jgi:transmembrane sensor
MAKLNWRIVDRYFAGEATAAERELVERWLADSPAFRMLVSEVYRSGLDESAVRQAQAEVARRLDQDRHAAGRPVRPRFPRRLVETVRSRYFQVLKIAAAVAVLLGGALVARQAARIAWPGHSSLAAVGFRTITAPAGQRTGVPLPDGSHIMLSPGSTIRYAKAFGTARKREIHLEGEAYFDVAHNEKRPFIVRAGNLTAEDLGTQFVARAYPEDRHGRVIVREGLVGIAGAVVSPGEVGYLSAKGEPIVERADTASWFAWTRGRLVFDGMPLGEVLPKLSRWYDLDFRLADSSLGDVVLVAALPEQADDALDVIALALRLQVRREGRVVTFSAR